MGEEEEEEEEGGPGEVSSPLLVGDEFHREPMAQTTSGSLGFPGAPSQGLADVCSVLSCFGVHCKPEENAAKRNAAPRAFHAGLRPSFSR